MSGHPLLAVDDLGVAIGGPAVAPLRVLHDVAFSLERGETLGIVGESGSGKSMLALAIMGLLPAGGRASGQIRLEERDLLTLPEAELCRIRGRRIGMIFQEPMTALNPAMRIGDQIAEGLIWHRGIGRAEARRVVLGLLDQVRIAEAARRIDAFPHELSGGQRQRVGIAIALALKPDLMIADEPTTALDVTVQAEILDILCELVRQHAMALILISHDFGVVARATRQLLVLYAGTRMEYGATEDVLRAPLNPYTRGLLAAMPRRRSAATARLATIPGAVPGFANLPPGCRFAPRCGLRIDACEAGEPAWRSVGQQRGVRCIRAGTGAGASA